MRAYILGIICAAFVVSVLSALAPEGAGQGIRRFIGTVFLILTVLIPLGRSELPELELDHLPEEALRAAEAGKAQAEEAFAGRISESLEAYILTKAAELELQPQVRVELDRNGLPVAAVLTGDGDPGDLEALAEWIARDLGLGKEAVTWNVSHQSSE